MTWKEQLAGKLAADWAQEIDIYETQLELRKLGKIDEKLFAAAHDAAKLLAEPFDTGQFEVFVNDRLQNPSAAQIAEAVGGKVTPKATDPRERLTFVVQP